MTQPYLTRSPLLAAAFLLVLVSSAPSAEPTAPPLKEPSGELSGPLVLGGGKLPDSARERFLELAGGARARLVVIAGPVSSAPEAVLETWKKQPAASVTVLRPRNRQEAGDPAFVKPLTEATGGWLEGDEPAGLVAVIRGTALEKELHRLQQRGGVVGATHAALGSGTEPGLTLLPGFVVEAPVSQRGGVERLQRALGQHPGYAGLEVDEGAVVVLKGRRLLVLGDASVVTCLAASSRRPASVQILKKGHQADLIALSRAAVARAGPAFPPEKPEKPDVAHGALLIGGGGGLSDAVWKRFLDLAGGPDALIVVVPTALEDPIPAEPIEAKLLRRAGARNVKVLHTRNRAEADTAAFAAPLRDAKGVWFTGGRQWHFVDAYAGTVTEKAFHDVLRRGGVIGGSSAGASIQSEYMPRGDPLGNLKIMAEGYERGFGFLQGVAVDQHFFVRRRQHDMTDLVTAYPQLLGIGIDEGTAVIVQGSVLEVAGKSKVAVYDRRHTPPPGEKDYEELHPGDRYDLAARQKVMR